MANDVYGEFDWRGMVYAGTEGVREVLAREKVTGYIGFDPTASSLHVGSLLPLMALARLQRFGHTPIAIAGGGTGMIGDPSGKTQERQLLSLEQIEDNLVGIRAQLERFLDFDAPSNPARIVNNADWLAKLDLMSFLRDIGKHFTVNAMLAQESVKRRIESEDGISYTEFSYSLLQAYDFLTLFDRYHCTLQLGGSDQWGNIVSGADLIRKLRAGKAHGLVMPLVTTASGVKFGKTEAGAVWLDAGAHLAVPLLPVLAEHRRRRRHALPQVLHVPARGRDIRARAGVGGGARAARGAACPGAGRDASGPRAETRSGARSTRRASSSARPYRS